MKIPHRTTVEAITIAGPGRHRRHPLGGFDGTYNDLEDLRQWAELNNLPPRWVLVRFTDYATGLSAGFTPTEWRAEVLGEANYRKATP